ncbi:hypothetical protein [Agrobacterium larrymoorei]|uniref:Uncharacterized protein n=1 Tax=Agrobacterium larrymoorei TaxID=160699 RepID=A0A4D7DTS5_9HYPH|nr:hypothetical protein CFBP5473_21995 [Agrobacterium larrymoorei]QYA10672.1 hypothetical protein J5285_24235 [Agrobacterium larrymoorei]
MLENHGEAKDITFVVTERIEPASSFMGHNKDAATVPVFDGKPRAFSQIEFVSGPLQHGFTTALARSASNSSGS